MNPRVFVEVSDKYLWALRPFAYLFNVYWSELQEVIVYGFKKPDFELPKNFSFYSISPDGYPAERWSNALIEFLSKQEDEIFVLMLVDYWICRMVDVRGVSTCADYMVGKKNVLRFDLTADRLYAGGMYDVDYWGCYDIIETPPGTPYQLSLQAAIWNRKFLLDLLVANRSAWEIETDTRVPGRLRVLGTRQFPVRYANAVLKGKIDWEQLNLIQHEHRSAIADMIPAEMINKSLEKKES